MTKKIIFVVIAVAITLITCHWIHQQDLVWEAHRQAYAEANNCEWQYSSSGSIARDICY